MSEALVVESVGTALAQLQDAVDAIAACDLTCRADQEVLEFWRDLEALRRRFEPVDQAIIAEVTRRGLAFTSGCRSTALLARQLLRIRPAEAIARVKAAEALGPRRTVDGQPLEPIYPTVAAAQADGIISAAHARVVVDTVEKLPDEVAVTHDRFVESWLVERATEWDPELLAKHGRDLVNRLDPDGTLRDIDYRDRHRDLRLINRPDGSARIEGDLSAECAERLRAVLTPLAKPVSSATTGPDLRSAGQRRHDGLHELVKLVQRAGSCPTANGVSATIVVHMDVESYATGEGMARTGSGYAVPAEVAKRWAGLEARMVAVLLSKTKEIVAYSATQRIFTEQQRLALMARDKGCSFPGCDAPPGYCEAHHVTEYQQSRRTSVDDATLLCTYHHDHFAAMGWAVAIIDGVPTWTPPRWLDPERRSVRNQMHDSVQ